MTTLPPHADNGNPTKCCTKCKQILPATSEYFPRQINGKYGLRGDCKVCHAKVAREHRAIPDVKENIREYNKSRNSRDDAYQKRPEVKERTRVYGQIYLRRPEIKEYKRVQRMDYNRRPEVRIRERVRVNTRNARKRAIPGSYTAAQIQDLLKRQKYTCYYCSKKFEQRKGKYVYHIDHTFPISRVAGSDIPANDISYLVLACPTCNESKNDRFPWEFPEGGKLL